MNENSSGIQLLMAKPLQDTLSNKECEESHQGPERRTGCIHLARRGPRKFVKVSWRRSSV
jgi:hypothetical protein